MPGVRAGGRSGRASPNGASSPPPRSSRPRRSSQRCSPARESFACKGIAPPSKVEQEELARFLAVLSGRSWHDPTDRDASAAWQHFAAVVGPYRAIHLMRSRDAPPAARFEEDIGRISVL